MTIHLYDTQLLFDTTTMLNRSKILIIDHVTERRARLREALRAVVFKGKYEFSLHFDKGLQKLQAQPEEAPFHYVFVGFNGAVQQANLFLTQLKGLPLPHKPKTIFSLPHAAQTSFLVADLLTSGAHGFVCEPYSADALLDTMMTSAADIDTPSMSKSKGVRIGDFLLTDALRHLEQIVDFQCAGNRGTGRSGKSLRQISVSFKEITKELDSSALAEMLSRQCDTAKPAVQHPGAILRALMAERSITEESLLKTIKLSAEDLTGILNQTVTVSEEIAREITRTIGKTPSFWCEIQRSWDEHQASMREHAAHTP